MTAPVLPSTDSEPLALVALDRDDRVTLGFARAVIRLLGEGEGENMALRRMYLVHAERLDAINERARASAVRGGQPHGPQGIIGRNDSGREG